MTHHRTPGAPRRPRTVAAALAAVLLAPVAVIMTTASAPAAAATPQVVCTSKKAGLASTLTKGINAALKGRTSTTAIYFTDRATGTSCHLRAAQKFDSASVVKVTVLGALLMDAQKQNRSLTSREQGLAKAMITQSDNASTSTLWKQLGVTKIQRFLTAATMTQTVPGSGGYWGLTQITARDQQRLLHLLTTRGTVLTDASRAYVLKLMREVVPSQRWGTPAGAPATATIQVKNGWVPRATHGWRVHSIGAFTGAKHDYTMTVLTQGNRTMNDGVNTIQAVARAIHKGLGPAATTRGAFTPSAVPHEAVPATPEQSAKDPVPATR
ncbi:serine hydrolase [Streptomyces sp. NPDC004609]|uniref:serine hydrolase n=1 Tax=Streptomyces sp. NPDC004609 TaxID=3364704 RepID=UPI0036885DAE